jgi:hypothetical protein
MVAIRLVSRKKPSEARTHRQCVGFGFFVMQRSLAVKGDRTVRGETVESLKERMLARFRECGQAGATKTDLGVKSPKGRAAQALQELLGERRVANLGSPTRPRYVLSEHFHPLERACEQIERNALSKKPVRGDTLELLLKKELEKGCEGEVRKKIDEAFDWLAKEKRLVRLCRGRSIYWVSAENVKALVALEQRPPVPAAAAPTQPSPSPAGRPMERRLALAAYQRLRSRLGYSNVEISALRRELEVPMDELGRFLLEESRLGRAVLSLGDWSVSSDEIRSGAVELFGRPHLLVRFDAE